MQWLVVPTEIGAMKDNRWTRHKVKASKAHWCIWGTKATLPDPVQKVMLTMMERYQNTQCISVCCVWSCVAANQSGCPSWALYTTKSTYNGHWSSEMEHKIMEEGGLVWQVTFFNHKDGWVPVQEKLPGRGQADGGSVANAGNYWESCILTVMWMILYTYNLPTVNIVPDHIYPLQRFNGSRVKYKFWYIHKN